MKLMKPKKDQYFYSESYQGIKNAIDLIIHHLLVDDNDHDKIESLVVKSICDNYKNDLCDINADLCELEEGDFVNVCIGKYSEGDLTLSKHTRDMLDLITNTVKSL